MANNSAKKNQQSIRSIVLILTYLIYGLIGWVLIFNSFYLVSEQISIWHWLLCAAISGANYFCLKQVIKCWQLQLPPEATEYYYDFLALNSVVSILDPFTHKVWYLYWLIVVYIAWIGGKWLWEYITPKYDEPEEQEVGPDGKKKEKKQKKEKIKYIKR